MDRNKKIPKPRDKCNPQELLFCEHYSTHGSGQEAVIYAGYSPKTAKQHAQNLLKRPNVQAELSRIYAARQKANEVTAKKVIAEYAKIGFAEIGNGIRAADKIAALNSISKVIGIWVDKTEHSGNITTTTIPDNIPPEEAREAYLKYKH